jgi:hypothetical protein
MGNLAWEYLSLGEHQSAKELQVSVLEKQKQLLGDNHPYTLLAMGNLATIQSQGDSSDSDHPIPPKGILWPDQPFILTLIAGMQQNIVDKAESEVD